MQEGNYRVAGVKRLPYLYDGFNIKQNLPLNGRQARTKSMIHQQISITFKAMAHNVVLKLLQQETYCTFQQVAIDFTPPTAWNK